MIQKIAWSVMTLSALIVAAYAAASLISPTSSSDFVQSIFSNTPVALSLHLAGGLIAIVAGAFQVNSRLRSRYLPTHRWLGRLYVVAVMTGGVSGLVLAVGSAGGLVANLGFGFLAVCWLGTTLSAYRCIRAGDIPSHRAWMLRSYALTLAAVTLRIYLPLSLVSGLEIEAAYQAIAWLCWVPNLLVVDWFILKRWSIAPVAA